MLVQSTVDIFSDTAGKRLGEQLQALNKEPFLEEAGLVLGVLAGHGNHADNIHLQQKRQRLERKFSTLHLMPNMITSYMVGVLGADIGAKEYIEQGAMATCLGLIHPESGSRQLRKELANLDKGTSATAVASAIDLRTDVDGVRSFAVNYPVLALAGDYSRTIARVSGYDEYRAGNAFLGATVVGIALKRIVDQDQLATIPVMPGIE